MLHATIQQYFKKIDYKTVLKIEWKFCDVMLLSILKVTSESNTTFQMEKCFPLGECRNIFFVLG